MAQMAPMMPSSAPITPFTPRMPLCWTTKESQSSCDVFVPPAPHHPPLGGDGEQEGRTRSSDEPTLPLPALGGEGKGDRRQPDRQEPRRGQKMPFGPRLALGVGLGESTLCAGCLCPLWVHSHRWCGSCGWPRPKEVMPPENRGDGPRHPISKRWVGVGPPVLTVA